VKSTGSTSAARQITGSGDPRLPHRDEERRFATANASLTATSACQPDFVLAMPALMGYELSSVAVSVGAT